MGKNFFRRWFVIDTTHSEKSVSPDVERQAQAGDAEAQFQLGLKYSSGNGAAQDEVQAASWYLKAAEQNHGLAQFHLGQMFATGQGVPQNTARSVSWFRRAAHLGIADAQFKWGCACQRASMDSPAANAPEARIEAYMWYELAAAKNHAAAKGAYAQLTIKMTRDEVAEARRRIGAWKQEPCLTDLP